MAPPRPPTPARSARSTSIDRIAARPPASTSAPSSIWGELLSCHFGLIFSAPFDLARLFPAGCLTGIVPKQLECLPRRAKIAREGESACREYADSLNWSLNESL